MVEFTSNKEEIREQKKEKSFNEMKEIMKMNDFEEKKEEYRTLILLRLEKIMSVDDKWVLSNKKEIESFIEKNNTFIGIYERYEAGKQEGTGFAVYTVVTNLLKDEFIAASKRSKELSEKFEHWGFGRYG